MSEEKKVKIEGAAQKTKKVWLCNPKKPNFTAPTLGLESVYFKFELTQDMVGFIETHNNMVKYAAVFYKHNSVDGEKSTEDREDPEYTYKE